MRRVIYYQTIRGRAPARVFISDLTLEQREAVLNDIRVVRDLQERVPKTIFKKLPDTGLWEIRTKAGGVQIRLLSFFDGGDLIVVASGFVKKSRKTSKAEIETAASRMRSYMKRKP